MKKIVVFFAALVVALALNSALADDYNPPPWERGSEGTTYQRWEFSVEDYAPGPEDDYQNQNGVPSLTVTDPATRLWLPTDLDGTTGVMKFEDLMTIEIANFNNQNPLKEIWIQLTYSASGMPIIYADDPGGGRFFAQLQDETPIGDYYLHATWQITMEPNPDFETIVIQPRDCTTYVDEIVIDTICIPEPMTVCLLGLGALALLRKRRP